MIRRLLTLTTIGLAAILCACGTHADSAPSIADITSALATQMLVNGTSRFASVEHVVAKSTKPAKNSTYTSSVHYEMVFNKGLAEITRELESAPKPTSAIEAQSRQKLIYGLMALKLQFGNFASGLRVPRDVNVALRRHGTTWDLTMLPNAPGARLASGPPPAPPVSHGPKQGGL